MAKYFSNFFSYWGKNPIHGVSKIPSIPFWVLAILPTLEKESKTVTPSRISPFLVLHPCKQSFASNQWGSIFQFKTNVHPLDPGKELCIPYWMICNWTVGEVLIYVEFFWVTSVLHVSDVTMCIGDLQDSLNMEYEIWICASTAPLTKENTESV